MPWARIVSVPLLEARNLRVGEWYPILDIAPAPAPAHFVYVVIRNRPQLIWSGHLEIVYTRPEGY
jgi:hypothetical protein